MNDGSNNVELNTTQLLFNGVALGGGVDMSNYATTASLSSYALASSLSSYALASSLSSYATTASLSSYALLSSLSNYASMTVANTFSALQTFSSGLTVPAGQTLICDGTLTGGTITATTQAVGNNTNLVATTTFVNRLLNRVTYTWASTGQNSSYILPAQTAMNVFLFVNGLHTVVSVTITPPPDVDLYIGQKIYVCHSNNTSNTFQFRRTANISIGGSGQFIGSSSPATQNVQTIGAYKTAMVTWINCNDVSVPPGVYNLWGSPQFNLLVCLFV